ncbi:MAG: ABC transporter substrate-binding protein, partial [Candidatus Dormibacterales bacterium]
EDHTRVVLRRNPSARPAPDLDRFVFQAFPTLSGAVNAVLDGTADTVGGVLPPQLAGAGSRSDLTVYRARTFQQMAVFLDLSPQGLKLFDPPQVRQALNQAVDRKAIIREVLGGQADPAFGPIPPSNWAYSPVAARSLRYDPAAARSALTAAGWSLPPGGRVRVRGGTQFTVTLVTPDVYPYVQVATALRRYLGAVGVSIALDQVPSSILVGHYLIPREYQMVLAQLDSGPDADQSAFWHSGQPGDSLNFTPLPHQALVDKDLDDAEAAAGQAARRALYDDFQALVAQAAPALFIYEPRYLYLVNARVRGVSLKPVVEPSDRFQGVAGWYVVSTGG